MSPHMKRAGVIVMRARDMK